MIPFLKQYFFVIFLIFSIGVFAQYAECDKIYEAENLTKEAVFSGSKSQFMTLMMDSVLCDLNKIAYDSPPTSLKVAIDFSGRIIESIILSKEFEKRDREVINSRMLKLDNWLPGEIDGKAVCSYYYIIISCIFWN